MLNDLNDIEQLKLLCAALLSKSGGRERVTAAQLEDAKGKAVRVSPANEKGDELFISFEEELE
jgi:hypothetical protein